MTPDRVAVIGLGLIGASLSGAFKVLGSTVCGFDSEPRAMRTALGRGLVDEVSAGLHDTVSAADFVILAAPIAEIRNLLPEVDRLAPATAIITDVGSVKAPIVDVMARLPGAARMIGGHPIAGKESSGPSAAEPDIFRARPYVLVPSARTSGETLRLTESYVREIGGRPTILSAEEHDRIVARTSHLPQIVSTAIALSIDADDAVLAGTGLQGMTRLAKGSPALWTDILLSNRDNVVGAMNRCMASLESLTKMTVAGDASGLEQALNEGRTSAGRIEKAGRA